MAILKGYYNVDTDFFMGMMVAKNHDSGEAYTPHYIEGVCFGEYDTETKQFTPLTNPMRIPKGEVMYRDENVDAFLEGKRKVTITGIQEDKGADIARKQVFNMAPTKPKPKLLIASDMKEATASGTVVNGIDFDKLF